MGSNTRRGLTFGVEMELVYVHLKADFYSRTGFPLTEFPTRRLIKEFIVNILSHKLPPNPIAPPSILGNVITDIEESKQRVPYAQWVVTHESSIGADANDISDLLGIPPKSAIDICRWDQVELVSPIFRYTEDNWYAQLQQIQSDLSTRPRLGTSFCNETCGLHVHIAAEGPNNIPLAVLQNLVVLWASWEANIESFHPENRRAPLNYYAASLGKPSTAKEHGTWCDMIYRTRTSLELRDALAPAPHRSRFVKLYISASTEWKRETVEFREHRGTVNADEISWWVIFIEQVVNFAWDAADRGYRFYVPGLPPWGTGGVEEMWEHVGLSEEGREYFRAKIREYKVVEVIDLSDS